MYYPTYKRFKFNLHMAFEKKKFYGRHESEITKIEWLTLRLFSTFGAMADKVAEEHFDFILGGSDCLLSLCQAVILQEKGYRVLVYPYKASNSHLDLDNDSLNTLTRGYSELESEKLINYAYRKILNYTHQELEKKSDLVELIYDLCGTITGRNKHKSQKFGQVIFVASQRYAVDKDWTSFYKNKPMFSLKNGEVTSMDGVWKIPLSKCDTFSQNPHRPEDGYFGVSDTCIITFDSFVLNTRPNFNMSIDPNKHSVVYFGDAKNQIDKRSICTVLDRVKDLCEVLYHFKTNLPGEKNVR